MKKIMKDKKADIAITLLVFMTLVLVGVTLFSFILGPGEKADIKLTGVKIIDSSYLAEEQIKFYMKEAGERALINSYDENDNFAEINFKQNFKQEIGEYPFSPAYGKAVLDFAAKIKNEDFDVILLNNFLIIQLIDFSIENITEDISLYYQPKIEVRIELKSP